MLRFMTLSLLTIALPAAADRQPHRPSGGGLNGEVAPEDQKAIHDFKLTNSAIDKLLAAGPKIHALVEKDPSMAKADVMHGAKNIDDSVKRMQQYPQGIAALKSAGLSPREFIVSTQTLGTAMMWSIMKKSYPQAQVPAYVNPDNMKFVDDHPDVMQKFQAAWGGEDKTRPHGGPDARRGSGEQR
jgi:hypothetical protein